ncbi:MAG TPA: MBL fold metallo-hydrolase [Candidatus Bipolaricaulota bacterium]
MQVETLTLTPYQSNCYLVGDGQRWVVIDPGAAEPSLTAALAQRTLSAVVCTHAHPDHVGGVPTLVERGTVPLYLHPAGYSLLQRFAPGVEAFVPLADEQVLTLGGLSFRVLHVPGHSPDQVVLIAESERVIFVGDLVFAGSIGRTDFPLSDPQAMERSLRRLAGLPGDYTLYPGHGPTTTLERERQTNPFLVPLLV